MKNNSELNEFIEQLGRALVKVREENYVMEVDAVCFDNVTVQHSHDIFNAALILHEIATNPKYEDMNAREALDDLIGGK